MNTKDGFYSWVYLAIAAGIICQSTAYSQTDAPTQAPVATLIESQDSPSSVGSALPIYELEYSTTGADVRKKVVESLPPTVVEAGTCCDEKAGDSCSGCGSGFDWKKVPPVRIFPPLGNVPIPPKGPGYYSLLDVLTDTCRENPPKYPYSPIGPIPKSFFDSDFRYLEDPKNKQHDIFDPLHRIHLGDNWLISTGGEIRWRHMHEVNRQLSGRSNNYELFRTRVYGDFWYRDNFRLFAEFIDAHSFNEDVRPLPIDVNRSDMLNLFIDVKVADVKEYPAYVRVGRQELLLGSQRLISPLDWANTRRTFQGVRAFRQGEKFDFDLFWVQPVVPDPSNFDSVANNVNFAGLWTTYRPKKGSFIDGYFLFLDNTRSLRFPEEPRAVAASTHTLGGRWRGQKKQFLWDAEGMIQLGSRGDQSIIAGSAAIGGGWNFKELPLTPTFWVYYDYASGDNNPAGGDHFTTFNQLFPFGHYYLGWIDLVARQNIHDVNAHLFLYPTRWITVWTQYHHFELASSRDALYNAAGVPIRRDPTGNAGSNVGDEFDLVVNFHLDAHSDVFLGYSKLFAGDFLRRTGVEQSPELFYLQYSFRW